MSLVFEKLTQFLSAGQVWRLTIAADFFRIAAAAWPVKVRILKAGRILGEMDGWQAGDFVRDVQFDAVEIEAGAIAQTVTVQIAGGGVGSDRVLGEVSVIDGAIQTTRSNQSFIKSRQVTTTPGNFGAIGIWNPAGSGKEVELSRISTSATSAAGFSVGWYPTQLPTNIEKARSKLSGGMNSSAEISNEIKASAFITDELFAVERSAGIEMTYQFKEPMMIKPGAGLVVWCASAGVAMRTFFEFVER